MDPVRVKAPSAPSSGRAERAFRSPERRRPRDGPTPEQRAVLALQGAAGNAAVAGLLRPPGRTGSGAQVLVQRCGAAPCGCLPDDMLRPGAPRTSPGVRAEDFSNDLGEGVVQRRGAIPAALPQPPAPVILPPRQGPTAGPGAGGPLHPQASAPANDVERGLRVLEGERVVAGRRARAEVPRPVLDRGGEPRRGFVTVADAEKNGFFEGELIAFRPHWFHILDAIDHEVDRARTVPDLLHVYDLYLREPPAARSFNPDPLPVIDPGGKVRLKTFLAAVTKRQKTLLRQILQELKAHDRADVEQLVAGARKNQGPCLARPVYPRLGNDARHNAFADLVTGSRADFMIAMPGGLRTVTDGVDAGDPKLVWEVKTRHEFLTEWALPHNIFSERVQDAIMKLEAQRQRHKVVTARCGYRLAYAFDTVEVAEFFQKHWNDDPPVHYRKGP